MTAVGNSAMSKDKHIYINIIIRHGTLFFNNISVDTKIMFWIFSNIFKVMTGAQNKIIISANRLVISIFCYEKITILNDEYYPQGI